MPQTPAFRIGQALSAEEVAAVASLFTDYAASLGFDLGFQNFAAELADMPGKYAPPHGALLLARAPDGRGLGIGAALIDAVIAAATRIGYREMRLDTLPMMAGALHLYRRAGFRDIPPYAETPMQDAIFLARDVPPPG